MAQNVIIKPVVTEKSTKNSEKLGRYVFKVERDANKISIKKAVEESYNVKVDAVNTGVTVGKKKTRQTKRGLSTGIKAPYKKAYVTLKKGETIDFYGSV
jgi:large subunit ribosomal protein L23